MTARCPHGHRWFRCPWPANPGVTELRIAADTYHLLNALQWFANDDVFFGRLVDPLMRNPERRYGWAGFHRTEPRACKTCGRPLEHDWRRRYCSVDCWRRRP